MQTSNLSSPGVYVVIYTSCTLWTAIFAVSLGKSHLSCGQWGGIGLITVGLLANGMENYAQGGSVGNKVWGYGGRHKVAKMVWPFVAASAK